MKKVLITLVIVMIAAMPSYASQKQNCQAKKARGVITQSRKLFERNKDYFEGVKDSYNKAFPLANNEQRTKASENIRKIEGLIDEANDALIQMEKEEKNNHKDRAYDYTGIFLWKMVDSTRLEEETLVLLKKINNYPGKY